MKVGGVITGRRIGQSVVIGESADINQNYVLTVADIREDAIVLRVRRPVVVRTPSEVESDIPGLFDLLKSPWSFYREVAAAALGQIARRPQEVVPALISVSEDENHFVRQRVAWALGRFGREAEMAVPAMAKRLKDRNPYVRAAAARCLGQIGKGAIAALDDLKETAKDNNEIVAASARAVLKKIDPSVEGARLAEEQPLRPSGMPFRFEDLKQIAHGGTTVVFEDPATGKIVYRPYLRPATLSLDDYFLGVPGEVPAKWMDLGGGIEQYLKPDDGRARYEDLDDVVQALALFLGQNKIYRYVDHPGFPKLLDAPASNEEGYRILTGILEKMAALKSFLAEMMMKKGGWSEEFINLKDQMGLDTDIELARNFLKENPSWLVMERFPAGRTLEDAVKEKKLDPVKKLDYFIEVAKLIQYLHAKGVIHRDIKPKNIWIGDNGKAMLIDFGIARVDHEKLKDDDKKSFADHIQFDGVEEALGIAMGAEAYMPLNMWQAGIRSYPMDIFTAGLTLAELFESEIYGGVASEDTQEDIEKRIEEAGGIPHPKIKEVIREMVKLDFSQIQIAWPEIIEKLEAARNELAAGARMALLPGKPDYTEIAQKLSLYHDRFKADKGRLDDLSPTERESETVFLIQIARSAEALEVGEPFLRLNAGIVYLIYAWQNLPGINHTQFKEFSDLTDDFIRKADQAHQPDVGNRLQLAKAAYFVRLIRLALHDQIGEWFRNTVEFPQDYRRVHALFAGIVEHMSETAGRGSVLESEFKSWSTMLSERYEDLKRLDQGIFIKKNPDLTGYAERAISMLKQREPKAIKPDVKGARLALKEFIEDQNPLKLRASDGSEIVFTWVYGKKTPHEFSIHAYDPANRTVAGRFDFAETADGFIAHYAHDSVLAKGLEPALRVEPEYEGRGLGSALVTLALYLAGSRGKGHFSAYEVRAE
ncbi:MAG: HEAT repeat domain-containing protein, partial [Candidatus Omnitrophota bacterium]